MNPHKERTFVIIKPDGVQRALVGNIIDRFEKTGLKLVGMKFTMADEDRLWKHYTKSDEWFTEKGEGIVKDKEAAGETVDKPAIEYGKDIIRQLVNYMGASPVVMLVLEGNQSVAIVKKLVGSTEPATSDVGTIRGDLTLDSYAICSVDNRAVRNLMHCSDEPEEAEREIALWMDAKDLIEYKSIQEAILYDVNLDGLTE